jgi:putative PIG3 family NAD(P)H quinone oxidoreductase
MRAIVVDQTTGSMSVADVPTPTPGPGEVLVKVAAAGVNRPDLLQRQGLYPPPPGVTDIVGMEISGTIDSVGEGVTDHAVGEPVCGLIAGGGYAEYAVVPAAQLLPVPRGTTIIDAAAIPEAAFTVWSTIVIEAALQAGETLLVHGGGSGIGTHAIQVAKALGATVAVTVGSPEKGDRCRALGADIVINYRNQDFADELGGSVDVILDIIGGTYLPRNLAAMATGGRLVLIGFQGGLVGELNIGTLIAEARTGHRRERPQPSGGRAGIQG